MFIFSLIIRLREPNDQIEKYIDHGQGFIFPLMKVAFRVISLTEGKKVLEVPFPAVLDQKYFLLAGKTRANTLTQSMMLMFWSAVVKSCLWLAS